MNDFEKQKQDAQPVLSSEPVFPADTYPHKYVHSVFEDQEDAEQAVQALRAAGFTPEDINFMTGQDYVQAAERGDHQQKNLAKSLTNLVSSLDYGVNDTYFNEARRGRSILSVRISGHDQIAQVRDILAHYHAQLVQYLDTWTKADLSDSKRHGEW